MIMRSCCPRPPSKSSRHLRCGLLIAALLPLSSVHAFIGVTGRSRAISSRGQQTQIRALAIVDLDDSNKDKILADDKTVLIDAYATFCGPCKLIEPVIERCAANREDVDFVRYNVEAANVKGVKFDLLMQKTIIRKLPTLILYRNGQVLNTHSGLINYEELEVFIANALHDNDTGNEEDKTRGKISFSSSLGRDDYALGV
uniref:Thioredoxin domain-containing protein n=1 Tax=Minutocellus polymorphus TaxID=265543 RepID=A0A7S0B187_9STRA|mmetsp:Transcript_8996/g.14867  ORF Transcript_8996/g.14867 Transcript_8996/m.14867 type:complete len:200 (+) Transcript_8996:142-741(+)